MHCGPAFAQLLAEKLREIGGNDRARASSVQARAFAPPHPLLFAAPYRVERAAHGFRPRPQAVEETRAPHALPAAKRTLTPEERFALDALNRRGAALSADFTAAELRSAYRTLARSYHPDRHHSSGTEQNAITRVFAEIANHHQTLLRVEHLQ